MENVILWIICFVFITMYAHNKNYLRYTDSTISNIKKQIKTDDAVQKTGDALYKTAKDLTEKTNLKLLAFE